MNVDAVDFLRRRGPPVLGWWLLALGVVAFAASLAFAQRMAAQRAQVEQAGQIAAAARRALQPAPRPVETTPAERRRRNALAQLRQPWLPALRAVESAAVEPVYLLSLNMEASAGLVRMDAEAPDFEHALAHVRALGESGVLSAARLGSHEQIADAATGRSVVRYTVDARWTKQ
jgi:hypothetical protein